MRLTTAFFVLLTAALLALLFWYFRPPGATPPISPANAVQSATPAPAENPAPIVYTITLSNGHRTDGPTLISATQGDEIIIDFTSDTRAELHLHGYDIELQLIPGKTARLQFTATHAGRFEYELHGHSAGHNALGAIEVLPK